MSKKDDIQEKIARISEEMQTLLDQASENGSPRQEAPPVDILDEVMEDDEGTGV